MARRADPETQLQIAVVNLLRIALPAEAIWHHSHNEGRRSKRDAGIAKAMGQRPGFPDLIILYRGAVYMLEFKSPAGRQSKEQREFETAAAATGFENYAIVRGVEDAVKILRRWGLLGVRLTCP